MRRQLVSVPSAGPRGRGGAAGEEPHRSLSLLLLLPLLLLLAPSPGAPAATTGGGAPPSFKIEHDSFMKDGAPFQVLGGEFHYFRTPSALWPDRLRRLKAMGLNTVTTYTPWNYHEQERGVVDLTTGERDLAKFARLVEAEGMLLALRLGPYICGEWEYVWQQTPRTEEPRPLTRSPWPFSPLHASRSPLTGSRALYIYNVYSSLCFTHNCHTWYMTPKVRWPTLVAARRRSVGVGRSYVRTSVHS